jgi:hypothetical protein
MSRNRQQGDRCHIEEEVGKEQMLDQPAPAIPANRDTDVDKAGQRRDAAHHCQIAEDTLPP